MALSVLSTRPTTAPHGSVNQVAVRRPKTLPYWFSGALAVVALIASAVGVFHPGVFHDPAGTAGNAQGTDVVILAVAIPTLVASMIGTARGSLLAQIVWLGALSYIVYNSVFFAYGAHFNSLFLVYAATLSLAVWSIVTLLREVDVEGLRANFAPSTPVRVIAGYLLVTTVLFALVWMKDVVPAIVNNTTPTGLADTGMVTNPVQVTDFAFGFPLTGLAAIWLWQRRAWGYLLGGAFLVYGVIEALSVATDQVFGHLRDESQSLAAVPVFVVLTLIALVPLVVYIRALREEPARTHYGLRHASSGKEVPNDH